MTSCCHPPNIDTKDLAIGTGIVCGMCGLHTFWDGKEWKTHMPKYRKKKQ